MKLLLIEDDEHKRNRVDAYLRDVFGGVEVVTACSVQGALAELKAHMPVAVILDMSLPVFDYADGGGGFQHLAFGGIDVLDFIDRIGINLPVIVLTAFDRHGVGEDAVTLEELDAQLRNDYPDQFVGTVFYSVLEDAWQPKLLSMLEKIAANDKAHWCLRY